MLDQLVAQARDEAPNECCGMIASIDGEAVAVHPAVNKARSPLRYEIDGMEQYRIQTAIEDAGHDLGAIYHSHTRSAPEPSQTDINLAFYPDALYLIVGVAGDAAEIRAWRIVEAPRLRGRARGHVVAGLPLECPGCGTGGEADERFCPRCGSPLVIAGATLPLEADPARERARASIRPTRTARW